MGNDGKRDGLCSWARANYLPGLGPRSLLCHMTISRVVCGHEILPHFLPVSVSVSTHAILWESVPLYTSASLFFKETQACMDEVLYALRMTVSGLVLT